ncbi:outer membrane protein assembly factor BamE [Reinekea blandensis]|uniref:Small protein A n=1 Tax=Reinekea blandensis MED297 TaxID=314283 RepID=A4BK68_9GAMM|nr:outer membrane protein assembly factor BamE [Reinekea blandensis]EAR07497.1 small protein A [Reinekea sp. MED297] [Reinekea blandensis MED297]
MLRSRLSKTLFICLGIIALNGCILLEPYEAELGQGNYIREEQLQELEIGQTGEQVSFLLGTPLLTGEQTAQRWVYPTYSETQGYQKLFVYFTDGVVSGIEQVPSLSEAGE